LVASIQLYLTNRQNGDQGRKQHRSRSGKSRPFITRRRTRKGLDRREGTKPYLIRATIANWIRRNQGTKKDPMNHDGDYSSTRRSETLGKNPDPERRTHEINHRIPKRRNQKAPSQGTQGLPRRTTQSTRMASTTDSIHLDSRMAKRP